MVLGALVVVALVLGALVAWIGVLLAAFFLPVVSASSAVAEDGVALFESYPSELEVQPLNEASRIEAARCSSPHETVTGHRDGPVTGPEPLSRPAGTGCTP